MKDVTLSPVRNVRGPVTLARQSFARYACGIHKFLPFAALSCGRDFGTVRRYNDKRFGEPHRYDDSGPATERVGS